MDGDELDDFVGISNTQFAAFDRDVASTSRVQVESENQAGNPNHAQENDWPDDEFGELTEEQCTELDRTVEEYSENHEQIDGSSEQIRGSPEQMNDNHEQNNTNQEDVTPTQLDIDLAVIFNDDDGNEPMLKHLECLKSKFHLSSFRERQWEIIHSIMNKRRDVCAVMATGYGKSLCYQFPAVYKNGMVLVVCPLIALMQAQVMAMEDLNIKACYVGSAQPDQQILARIHRGEFNIIYSSPEYLQTPNGKRMIDSLNGRLMLIAIDGE